MFRGLIAAVRDGTYYPSTSSLKSQNLSSLSCLSTILCSAGGSFARAGSLSESEGVEVSVGFLGGELPYLFESVGALAADDADAAGADAVSLVEGAEALGAASSELFPHHILTDG